MDCCRCDCLLLYPYGGYLSELIREGQPVRDGGDPSRTNVIFPQDINDLLQQCLVRANHRLPRTLGVLPSQEASDALIGVKAAGFDDLKSFQKFNYDFQPAAPRDVTADLAT